MIWNINSQKKCTLHVWQLGECAIKDVVDRMESPKPYTTVASIFQNLRIGVFDETDLAM